MIIVQFSVYGIPRPQGSKTPTAGGGFRESSKGLPAWRQAVKLAARRAVPGGETGRIEPWTGACELAGAFYMPRALRPAPGLEEYPLDPPDVDKLCRALGDALTDAGVIADDSLIIDFYGRKRYAVGPPGADVILRSVR